MTIRIIKGDCRTILPTLVDQSVYCCVTSPPYFGLRDYGIADQIGLEPTPQAYVEQMVAVFREVRRVLRDDGTLWLNLGDSYGRGTRVKWGGDSSRDKKGFQSEVTQNGHYGTGAVLPNKQLIGIPWRVAFALQADGWYLRQDIIWSKPNPMPESVTDRCTKAHEYIFLLSKNARYYYDADAIAEPHSRDWSRGRSGGTLGPGGSKKIKPVIGDPNFRNGHSQWERSAFPEPNEHGRNKRSVWEIATQPYSEAHFATFPRALIEPCIKAGCPKGGTVLDPFGGAGTTGMVADRLGRNSILVELNPKYADLAEHRVYDDAGMFAQVSNV